MTASRATSDPPRLIFGLGNPGASHANDRHNAGFRFVELLARRCSAPPFTGHSGARAAAASVSIEQRRALLVKPLAWMNHSGQVVRGVLDYLKQPPAAALVVHDELDLPAGVARLKSGGGHGGHNGLRDVIRHCGPHFLRLRIGIGHPGHPDKVTPYVLSPPSAPEARSIAAATRNALDAIATLYRHGLQPAMTRLHSPGPAAGRPRDCP